MRQLAVLPDADAAQTLADRLQTLRIETRLERAPEGWLLWVFDEDRLPQARQELADFTANPADPRFAAARRAAEASRRQLEKEEQKRAAGAPPPRADPPPVRPGLLTRSLMVVCLLVFLMDAGYVVSQHLSQGPFVALSYALHLAPDADNTIPSPIVQSLAFSSYEMKLKAGSQETVLPWPREILSGQVWRLITPIFIHFGPVHLLFNMWFLFLLGGMIEDRRGPWRLLSLVLVCAVISNVAQYGLSTIGWQNDHFATQMPGLFGGMSGVLYGLFGYVWMKGRYEPDLGMALSPRLVFWMIAWLFLCMTGVVGHVANVAHVTGLIVGVLIGVGPHLWRRARGTRPT